MCVGKIFNYCSLLHFNEVKYFSQDGRGLPNGIGFQRGNFIKECAENASSFVLSEIVFGGQNISGGRFGGVIILPVTEENHALCREIITKTIAPISHRYSIGNAFRGLYIGTHAEVYDADSITIEVGGLSSCNLLRFTASIAKALNQTALIVKDHSSNKIYRYK